MTPYLFHQDVNRELLIIKYSSIVLLPHFPKNEIRYQIVVEVHHLIFCIMQSTFPYHFLYFRKMKVIQSHKISIYLQVFNRLLRFSFSFSQRQHHDAPIYPLLSKFSRVKTFWCKISHKNFLIFGQCQNIHNFLHYGSLYQCICQ